MLMIPEDIALFPKSTGLIKSLEVVINKTPKVLAAFLKACMEDKQSNSPQVANRIALRTALPWGSGPQVFVHDGLIDSVTAGSSVLACGWNNSFYNNRIEIASVFFEAHEFCGAVDSAKNAQRLVRILLHEMVHWVRDEAGADDDVTVGGNYKGYTMEAGRYFENLAYGANTSVCNSDNVIDALASIGPQGEERLKALRKSAEWTSLRRRRQ